MRVPLVGGLRRSEEEPTDAPEAAPGEPLCAWISDSVLIGVGPPPPAADGARPLRHERGDERPGPEAAAAVYAMQVSAEGMPPGLTDLATLLRERVALWTPGDRRGLLDFLASLGDEFGLSPSLVEGLHQAREALRERRPESVTDPRLDHAVRLDRVQRLDDHRFFVSGRLSTPGEGRPKLTIVTPEGESIELRSHLLPLDRGRGSEGVAGGDGFVCFVETRFPSRRAQGWTIELDGSGGGVEATAAVAGGEPWESRPAIVANVLIDAPERERLIAEHVHQALSWLHLSTHQGAEVAGDDQLGDRPEQPSTSIVVPVGSAIDLIEHQIVAFVDDPDLAGCELIYVLDSPAQATLATALARELHALYRLPLRLVVPDRPCGPATAVDLAARTAAGERLLLLDPDVIPSRHGWLGRMQRFYEATPSIGALTPKLLHEDEAIRHAGFTYERRPEAPGWARRAPFRGLHSSFAAANVTRPVPAASLACMMIDARLLHSVGGLEWVYAGDGFLDTDLCLRLAQAGRSTWYLPVVEMYQLEESRSWAGPAVEAYDAWVHQRLHGERIEALIDEGVEAHRSA